VFTLILVGGSFVEFPITHKALSIWVMDPFVRVTTLEKVVAGGKEMA
jgi:hypothetical protein